MSNDTTIGPNPSGFCMCGCGQITNIARRTRGQRGDVLGKHVRYIQSHGSRAAFFGYVEEDRGHSSPCWIWQGGTSFAGYGCTSSGGKKVYAHRLSYERSGRAIDPGLELDHLCRNPRCINPAHLEAVTHAENSRRGCNTKLTHSKASAIRELLEFGELSKSQIGDLFGVGRRTINAVALGQAWA